MFVSTNQRFAGDFRDHIARVASTSIPDGRGHGRGRREVRRRRCARPASRPGGLGDEDLLVIAGDNLISFDIAEFIDYFEQYDDPTLAAYDVGSQKRPAPTASSNSTARKSQTSRRSLTTRTAPSSRLPLRVPAERSASTSTSRREHPDEPGWFIQWLVDDGPVRAFTFDDAWYDIGTPESYLEAVAWELDGDNVVAEDATIENTTLGENVHILSGAEVVNSSLDGTIVFPDTTILDSDIRQSIIDRDTQVESLDLAGALTGAHTR